MNVFARQCIAHSPPNFSPSKFRPLSVMSHTFFLFLTQSQQHDFSRLFTAQTPPPADRLGVDWGMCWFCLASALRPIGQFSVPHLVLLSSHSIGESWPSQPAAHSAEPALPPRRARKRTPEARSCRKLSEPVSRLAMMDLMLNCCQLR